MMRTRRYIAGLAWVALLGTAFFTIRATAQQPAPTERITPYSFPSNWGDLVDTIPGPTGFTFVFEQKNGSTGSFIRLVQASSGGILAIEVIPRR